LKKLVLLRKRRLIRLDVQSKQKRAMSSTLLF